MRKCIKKLFNTPHINFTPVSLFYLSFISLFFACLLSGHANAYSFGSTGESSVRAGTGYSSMTLYFNPTDGSHTYYGAYSAGQLQFVATSFISSDGYVSSVRVYSDIPARTMFRFSIRFAGAQWKRVVQQPFSTNDAFILDQSCSVQSTVAQTSTVTTINDVICSYLMYTDEALPSGFYLQGNLLSFIGSNGEGLVATMPQWINYVYINDESGGSIDTSDLAEDVGNILGEIRNNNTQNSYIYTRLGDMITLLGDFQDGQLSQSNIQTAVENGVADMVAAQEQANADAQSRWESDKQEQADKERNLEDQSGDLALSTPVTGNPFASLFGATDCVTLTTISSWFGREDSPMRVCSPYPSQIRPVLNFVTSAIVTGLLIRLYYKKLQGGYAS